MSQDDPKTRPVQIVLSDTGAWGSVTVYGKELPVQSVEIGVAGTKATIVTFTILALHCNIEFNYKLEFGSDENPDNDPG